MITTDPRERRVAKPPPMIARVHKPRATAARSVFGAAALAFALAVPAARGADPENCLSCHRYRGLARVDDDGKTLRLYYVDPNYCDRALGPHAKLLCTDCHRRSEVEVVPHLKVSPVDCTQACHLSPPGGVEIRFGHDGIARSLDASVHTPDVLDEANRLLGSPLRPGQSTCLLCHDEPAFRGAREGWVARMAPVDRCDVCHTEQLPKDTRYYYWHVFARSRSARSHRDVTRVCALCHSHAAVRREFALPDSTASFLNSFHGRAMLLGSEDTAACPDCHAGPLQDVHLMRAHADPESSVHTSRLPDTCRSPTCHPTAGYAMSTAAVHLDLSTSRGIEYLIAVLFVFLIIFTFGPSVVLQALEMLQVVFGRQDPAHAERHRLAVALLEAPEGRRRLCRFTPHQRVQHWLLFATFTSLVITGFALRFADRGWAAWVTQTIGNLHRLRLIHRVAGTILLAGMAYHLIYVGVTAWRQKRRTGKSLVQTFLDLPMVMRWHDWKELGHLLGYLLFLRKTRPEAGRFSFEEKFEYFGVFWGCTLLGITGILLWANAWTTEHLTGRVLTVAALVHAFEAFLALLHVGIVHMAGVIFAPSVFPLSPAMFTGDTPAEEMAEAHSAMLTEAAKATGITAAKEVGHG